MQRCSKVLIKLLALLLCILLTFVIIDLNSFRRHKAEQAADTVVVRRDGESPEFYLSREEPKQLYKVFKTIKLLLFYELELKDLDESRQVEGNAEYKENLSRKINHKYRKLFHLIRGLRFEFTRRRFKYLTRSLNVYLKNIIVEKYGEEEGRELLFVQKKMVHELGSTALKALFTREEFTEEVATMYIKIRHNLKEIYEIMQSFHHKPNSPSGHECQRPCPKALRSREERSRSNYDFSRSDLNHTRLKDIFSRTNRVAEEFPVTKSHPNSRRIRDANISFTTLPSENTTVSRTWRTLDFFATLDDRLPHLEELYPDYFLSKRPITSMDQIPTAPEDYVMNLKENPDRHGYTRKRISEKWREMFLNMTEEEMNYAIQAFRENKTEDQLNHIYDEYIGKQFLPELQKAVDEAGLNISVTEGTKKTQKKKVRTGTPPASRAPNATRRFFNGSRPFNFTRWTKKKNSTPLVRTKFIKVKKNKTTKPAERVRRQVSEVKTKRFRPSPRFNWTTPSTLPTTKYIYPARFNKHLPERFVNDYLTISGEATRKKVSRTTGWNFLNYRMRTTGAYAEDPDTAEIQRQWERRFAVRRQYDSVTHFDWDRLELNETGKSKFERGRESYGHWIETTTMSESDYLKTHTVPPDFWPGESAEINEAKFHQAMYESFYDMAGFTTAPVWFNSTKKTKHPKKLLKYTSPSHPSTTSPHPLPPNTTINFVKLLIQQKLKEYASSRLRPTGTQRTVPTFPHYILNQSYVTKFNDLFHQFEYYKRGVDLVNGSNVGLAENINNIEQYFKDFGEHLEDVQKDMERGLKISVDPKDATEIRTTGFVRYMEKSTHPPVHEKFVMSTLSSAEMYNRTYHPFLQEVVDLMAQMRDYQERMPEDKAKQRFMEIINKDRVGADRFNSSEVFQLLRENYGVTDTQAVADTQAVTEEVMEGVADAATAEPIKIEEIRDETEDGKVVKEKGIVNPKLKDSDKTAHLDGTTKKKKKKKKKKVTDSFAEDSEYKDDDSNDMRNVIRKQNLRHEKLKQDFKTEVPSIPSEEMEEMRKEWVRPFEEFEGNITYRKLNRYHCWDCGLVNVTYRAHNFSDYVEHYRVNHIEPYNRSKYTEEIAWKLGYSNPYQCQYCDFYEPFDNDVCYDHYEKDHPEHNHHDVYAQVFRMRKFYLDLRKKWPHNNSQELKTYVGDLFATPRYAGGTTECTVCRFHHPTPRDPVFFSQFYVLPTTESEQDYYDQIVGNRSGESLPSEEKKRGLRIPKWLQRDCDKYRDLPMPSGELLKNLSRGIFDSRSGENDTSEFKSDYYGSCDYRSQTLETGEDPWGSSCEDRM
ncbi:hypothetical protein M8J77_006203 [Diaphorina citri]|nr:hypothetical protein M8J77_006203 [Diaphorina citri]